MAQAGDASRPTGEEGAMPERGEGGARRRGKSKRKRERSGVVLFVGIWVVVLVTLAAAVNYFRGADEGEGDELGFGMVTEDQRLLAEHSYECQMKVMAFLDAGVPEGRVNYVLNPAETLGRMTGRKYDFAASDDETAPQQLIKGLINTPKGKAIESVWEIDGGRKIETVFFLDGKDEWKIDWANMVRYSELDWSLFLVEDGKSEGEFRLLARRRSEDSEGGGSIGSVVLISPRAGSPGELGASSPEIPVGPDSRIGRVLAAAFAKRDAGEGVYGSQAAQLDPNGMIRLRAKIVREEGDEGARKFVIREILACHWYEIDDLGLSD